MQRGIVIILAVLMFIISCSEDEPTPIPTPQGLDCNDIYPEYDSLITEFEPTFEWCLINNGDKYRFQLSEEENFESFVAFACVCQCSRRSGGSSLVVLPFS